MNSSEIKVNFSFRNISDNDEQNVKPKKMKKQKSKSDKITSDQKSLMNKIFGDFFLEQNVAKTQNQNGFKSPEAFSKDFKVVPINNNLPAPNSARRAENSEKQQLETYERPKTAPKRRPPMVTTAPVELPEWKSRGRVDRDLVLIDIDNQISRDRKWEWGSRSRPPSATTTLLGQDMLNTRKAIPSTIGVDKSDTRFRVAKTNGSLINWIPPKSPEHFYPAQICRTDQLIPGRPQWANGTTYIDRDERLRPLNYSRYSDDVAAETFHASFRKSSTGPQDYVHVTRTLDSVESIYREKKSLPDRI